MSGKQNIALIGGKSDYEVWFKKESQVDFPIVNLQSWLTSHPGAGSAGWGRPP